ncbi:hypothetical protein M2125_001011 [Polynucleobacter sphagniphilus]|uniref:hypothetical protein n=1 Tax=Polynucleobacter sphagniphilus TaxID=1743169 RepID=UPI00247577CE|nr:hypothetical protein [Polynucleobacter sphagniphilus]MDH6241204.1 hypothetical protein [Polynucleobacter sphagniphilus]
MKKRLFLIAILFTSILVGCGSVNLAERTSSKEDLALILVNNSGASYKNYISEVDGKNIEDSYLGKIFMAKSQSIYLSPGKHKIVIALLIPNTATWNYKRAELAVESGKRYDLVGGTTFYERPRAGNDDKIYYGSDPVTGVNRNLRKEAEKRLENAKTPEEQQKRYKELNDLVMTHDYKIMGLVAGRFVYQ